MNIGYDAKRAFQNRTGLGNYSRMVIDLMSGPQNNIHLFSPQKEVSVNWQPPAQSRLITPQFKHPLWRPWLMTEQIRKAGLEIYHGLSHELPFNIEKTSIAKVVTMHDCIFRHFPASYTWIDRKIYDRKWKNAVLKADKIIAISRSTADDLVKFYNADPKKIEIIHLFANEIYRHDHNAKDVSESLKKYHLEKPFFLFVGNHHPRKNLELVIRAFSKASRETPPLFIVGANNKLLKGFVNKQGLEKQILLPDHYIEQRELAHLYTAATALIYPSRYEGFGLPVLEAMQSGTAVITCANSSLTEVGGDAVLYTSPDHENELLTHISTLSEDDALRLQLEEKGLQQAGNFSYQKHQKNLDQLYEHLIG